MNTSKINDQSVILKIFNECDSLLGLKLNRNNFPGPQPVAIEKKDIELLKKK
jgi:hypothetical protein